VLYFLFFSSLLSPLQKKLTYDEQGLDLGRQPTGTQTGPGIGAEGSKTEELSPSFCQQFILFYAEWDIGWHKAIMVDIVGEAKSAHREESGGFTCASTGTRV